MYKPFIRHAARVIDSITRERGDRLKSIKHFADGSAVVTDSFRLYLAKDIHEKGKDVLTTKTGSLLSKEKLDKYPSIDRLIPDPYNTIKSIHFSTAELLQASELLLIASKIGNERSVFFDGNTLKLKSNDVQASYEFDQEIGIEIAFSVQFLVDAIKLFRSFRVDEVTFNYHGKLRPFTLIDSDEKLITLITPMRRF